MALTACAAGTERKKNDGQSKRETGRERARGSCGEPEQQRARESQRQRGRASRGGGRTLMTDRKREREKGGRARQRERARECQGGSESWDFGTRLDSQSGRMRDRDKASQPASQTETERQIQTGRQVVDSDLG